MRPAEYFTHTNLFQIASDDANCGEQFERSVLVFEDWAIIGATFSDKCRAYLHRRIIGACKYHQSLQ